MVASSVRNLAMAYMRTESWCVYVCVLCVCVCVYDTGKVQRHKVNSSTQQIK